MLSLVLATALAATPALAQSSNPGIKGLWLGTDYPKVTVRAGEDIKLNLDLYSYGLPPQNVQLKLADAPERWEADFTGRGRIIGAVFAGPDAKTGLQVKLSPKKDETVKPGTYHFTLDAIGTNGRSELPLAVTVADALPPKLTLDPEFPSLSGSPKSSFKFTLTLNNDSGDDATINLAAQAPDGFQVTFTKQYGTQEVNSIPVKAGESQKIVAAVRLPDDLAAGKYPVMMRASSNKAKTSTRLELDVSGRPQLSLSAPDGRLSGNAYAGEQQSFKLQLENRGTAPAKNVELSSFPPGGWKVEFEPKKIASVAPGAKGEVTALVTPSDKAIAGDYMLTLRSKGDGASNSADFRVTVMTSTLWGVVGIGVIAAALVVLVAAVVRYGRR